MTRLPPARRSKSLTYWRLSVLFFLLLSFNSIHQPVSAETIDFFVSLTGDDSNTGTLASSPFQSLRRAQEAVRTQIKHGLQASITVNVAAGVYELTQPLVFTPVDSGTDQHAIRYAALPGEKVILSGGQSIKNWQVQPDGKWQAQLPDAPSGTTFFRQLIVNDRRATRARWPNEDGVLHLNKVNDEVNQFHLDQPLPIEKLNVQTAELVVLQHWSITRGLISQASSNQVTTSTPMGWIGHGPATTASPGKTVFLEHSKAFLDNKGEWFFDKATGNLDYWPNDDETIDTTTAVFPRLDQLVRIEGTVDTPIRNLHFARISFEHVDFALPKIGYNEIQAAHYGTTLTGKTFVQPVAIECTHLLESSFVGCRFAHLNGSGIGFGVGCRDNKLQRCEIYDIGGNGVMIGWRGKGQLSHGKGTLDADWAPGAKPPEGNIVCDCRIFKCGADSFGGTGIWVAFSKSTRVLHNEISELPYTGISVGYRWNTSVTSQSDCLVDSNHIFDVMGKLADGGGIYTLGRQAGTVFRRNYIHDVHRSRYAHGGAPNNGFFIDEGSSGFKFESNVVQTISGEPVRFNNCQRESHTWRENCFGDEASKSPAAKAIIEHAGIRPPHAVDDH